MIFREILTKDDCEFVSECYLGWSMVFPSDVRNWAGRYKARPYEEQGYICEEQGKPVGFVLLQKKFFVAKIYEMCIHPNLRGLGYGKAVWKALFDTLQSEGVVVGEYEARPGIIANKTGREFTRIGEKKGKHSNLIIGRVTPDNEYLSN